ncbi:hypothetical protein CBL_00626 [Carabus blaptoides fortunei]
MFSVQILSIVLVLLLLQENNAQDISILRSVRECLRTNSSMVCLKEKALRIIDEAMVSDKPLKVSDYVDIVKDPNFQPDKSNLQVLPKDLKQRSEKLNDMLVKKVDEFFESRTIKFNLANVFDEGRAKKGGKKGGGMLMMAGLAMAGMMAQMAMGKIAMMAGAALMISKMALLMSSIIGLKKLVGSSGGSDSHVVYASSGGGDHGGGGGGWHRSLNQDEEASVLAYRSYSQNENNV